MAASGKKKMMKKNVCVSEIASALKNTEEFEQLRKNTVVMSPIVNEVKFKCLFLDSHHI